MRTKLQASGYVRARYLHKDSVESFFADDAQPKKKLSKESHMTRSPRISAGSIDSPVSIFSTSLAKPPPMKMLPPALDKSLVDKKKKDAVASDELPVRSLLPVTSMWAGARKGELWVSPRYQEIIEEFLDSEKLESRARLPIKSTRAERVRAEKEKQRGLETKHWIKHRAAKKLAKAAAEALDLGHDEAQADALDDTQTEEEAPMRREPRARKEQRRNAELRAKTRRAQRLASRDAKCFSFDDPVEVEAAENNVPPPRALDESLWRRLLRSGGTLTPQKTAAAAAEGATARLDPIEDAERPAGALRAKPPFAVDGGVHAKTARRQKAMARSKADKWWANYRGRAKGQERAHARWMDENGARLLGDQWAEEREPLRGNPRGKECARPHAALRAKTRRAERLAARDAKCFAFDDPVEVEAAMEAPAAAVRPAREPRPFCQTAAYALLCKEAEGPALSDVFLCGLVLSIAAAGDLALMFAAQKAGAALEDRLMKAAKAKGAASPKALKAYLQKGTQSEKAPAERKGRGASAALRKPRALNSSAGKRRC